MPSLKFTMLQLLVEIILKMFVYSTYCFFMMHRPTNFFYLFSFFENYRNKTNNFAIQVNHKQSLELAVVIQEVAIQLSIIKMKNKLNLISLTIILVWDPLLPVIMRVYVQQPIMINFCVCVTLVTPELIANCLKVRKFLIFFFIPDKFVTKLLASFSY